MTDEFGEQTLSSLFDLREKLVLVTGSTRGLGRAIARGLALLGARVVISGRDADAAARVAASLRNEGAWATSMPLDVTDVRDNIDSAIAELVTRHGVPTGLVNSAGIIARGTALELSAGTFDSVLATNLTGLFEVTKAVASRMLDIGQGSIVNVSSVLAQSGGRNVAAYAASKGGLAQLTRSLAVEWATDGVRVNAIAAGYFATDLTAPLRQDPGRSESLLSRIPMRRWGEAHELVGVTAFLLSSAAAYVTGAQIEVDGGWTAA